jgi:hypothetical protein
MYRSATVLASLVDGFLKQLRVIGFTGDSGSWDNNKILAICLRGSGILCDGTGRDGSLHEISA